MTDQALDILKLVLLGLLYLFFARVLWAVWSEVRRTSNRAPAQTMTADERDAATGAAAAPQTMSRRERRRHGAHGAQPARGRNGHVARLAVVEPKNRRGVTYTLGPDITIGRDPSSTIVIADDTYVSQRHARVYEVDGQAMVEDLGSTNGSFHNGNRLHGARLLHRGDRVQVGFTVLEAQ